MLLLLATTRVILIIGSVVVNGLIPTPRFLFATGKTTKTATPTTPLWFIAPPAKTIILRRSVSIPDNTDTIASRPRRSVQGQQRRREPTSSSSIFATTTTANHPRSKRNKRQKKQKKQKKKERSSVLQNADSSDDGISAMARVDPERYDALLAQKVDKFVALLREAIAKHGWNIFASSSYAQREQSLLPLPQIFPSPQKQGFRMRATFHVRRTTTAKKDDGGRRKKEETDNNDNSNNDNRDDEEENEKAAAIPPKEEEENDEVCYVMFEPGTRKPYRVTNYPMGSKRLQELMDPVREGLSRHGVLSTKLKDVRFHTTLRDGKQQLQNTTSTDAIVVLNYYDQASLMDEEWNEAAKELRRTISSSTTGGDVTIIGKSRKLRQNVVVGDTTTLCERLVVPTGTSEDGTQIFANYTYYQSEGSFSQPNAVVCQNMLGWAYNATTPSSSTKADDDLCELYCGNGCFTVVLASNFRRVLATESSHASVGLAQQNLETNSVANARVVRMTAEAFVGAWEEKHQQQRQNEETAQQKTPPNGKELFDEFLEDHRPNNRTLFVDPPRAGLDRGVRSMASKYFDRIVYVSCNPDTLARDLVDDLLLTHRVTNLAVFDQFPYTPHLEVGIVLERRRE